MINNESFQYFIFDHLNKNLKTSDLSKQYLINILNKYLYTENLYTQSHLNLALLYKQSLESNNLLSQKSYLNQIGDTSLFIAGFFPESFNYKIVSINYYKDMGKNAYLSLSRIEDNRNLKSAYTELCLSFDECVRCLNMISIKKGE